MVLATGPLITEFVAFNDATLADGDGIFSEWIEIHNPTSSSVSLDGWHLTDDRRDLTQWPLPDISLGGGEYLVVFASGQAVDNYVDGGGNLHTNFKLDGDGGEDLLLVEPDGVTSHLLTWAEVVRGFPAFRAGWCAEAVSGFSRTC